MKLDGKIVIITGANTGIGFETTLNLAKRGAKIIMACRDAGRAENAKYKVLLVCFNKKYPKHFFIYHATVPNFNNCRLNNCLP